MDDQEALKIKISNFRISGVVSVGVGVGWGQVPTFPIRLGVITTIFGIGNGPRVW